MSKTKSFLLSYKIKGQAETTELIEADDEACAIGWMIDEHDDDTEFEWIYISAGAGMAADAPGLIAELPAGVQAAYEMALAEAP